MNIRNNLKKIITKCREDGFKSAYRYFKRRAKARENGLPNTIAFESSSVCNINCSFCYIVKAPLNQGRRFLPLETFKKVVDETKDFLQEVMLHWRGDPLLNKNLPDMVLFATEHDIKSSLSTNGMALSKDISGRLIDNRLGKITICLDGTTREVYALHRCGGDLGALLDNINNLVTLKRKARSKYPYIDLQMIVTKKNQHQIDDFKMLAKKLGADGAYLMSLFIDRTAEPGFVKKMEEEFFIQRDEKGLSRYFRDEAGGISLHNVDTPCPQDARYPLVTCNGDLIGCCFDIFLKNKFGNCNDTNFVSLWRERSYADFRKGVMMPRRLDVCKNCMPKNREWTKRLF